MSGRAARPPPARAAQVPPGQEHQRHVVDAVAGHHAEEAEQHGPGYDGPPQVAEAIPDVAPQPGPRGAAGAPPPPPPRAPPPAPPPPPARCPPARSAARRAGSRVSRTAEQRN